RAPLQSVRMTAEKLARKISPDEKARSYITSCQLSTRHMGAMVGDMVEFFRGGLGAGVPYGLM
ncbi:sensor histidine kinase, partial [Pseudomonas syringae pv. tagetis]